MRNYMGQNVCSACYRSYLIVLVTCATFSFNSLDQMPYKLWRVLSEVISYNAEFCIFSLLQMSFISDLLRLFDIKDAFHVLFSLDQNIFFGCNSL